MNLATARCLRDLDIRRGSLVLEIGVGDGWSVRETARRGCRLVAADYDGEKLRALERRPGLDAVLLDAQRRLPFADRVFDLVVLYEVIEHLVDPDFSLAELKRVLRPDGKLLISTPNANWAVFRLMFLFGYCPEDFSETNHVHYFNWDWFQRTVRGAGFQLERVCTEVAIPLYYYPFHALRPILVPIASAYQRLRRREFAIQNRELHYIDWRPRTFWGWDFVIQARKPPGKRR